MQVHKQQRFILFLKTFEVELLNIEEFEKKMNKSHNSL